MWGDKPIGVRLPSVDPPQSTSAGAPLSPGSEYIPKGKRYGPPPHTKLGGPDGKTYEELRAGDDGASRTPPPLSGWDMEAGDRDSDRSTYGQLPKAKLGGPNGRPWEELRGLQDRPINGLDHSDQVEEEETSQQLAKVGVPDTQWEGKVVEVRLPSAIPAPFDASLPHSHRNLPSLDALQAPETRFDLARNVGGGSVPPATVPSPRCSPLSGGVSLSRRGSTQSSGEVEQQRGRSLVSSTIGHLGSR